MISVDDVKERIHRWLLDGEFDVEILSDSNTLFRMVAVDPQGIRVNILVPADRKDEIVIVAAIDFDEKIQGKIAGLSDEARYDFLCDLRSALLNTGLSSNGVELPLKAIKVSTVTYFDGLSKDTFMHRLLQVMNGVSLVQWMSSRRLKRQTTAPETVQSLEQKRGEKPIGVATMKKDGTIVLHLRAEGPHGILGDAQFEYKPKEKKYKQILSHLGGLEIGETKPVPPWPDRSVYRK